METFNFPRHKFRTQYPESSFRVQFGNSYTFVSKPSAPDQRLFILTFQLVKYYVNGAGQADASIVGEATNAAALDGFYARHRLYEKFIYPHPVYGNVVVRFQKPLEIPDGIEGGDGAIENLEVQLLEHP
ncbi:hypothetical protein [Inquilinus limosus]|uniref:Uncharacterized protein n=1 Tax=Inquilinus limosus MP06 TaxID=1398085 RepID=A0A0A0DGK3_9PROT|nr:hypothetical protein [Inquilinus limosus]KGM36127.1 hypothetical protein P409_00330 [Inquilinus limosus MP06]